LTDEGRLIAEWTEYPFVSYDKRSKAVEKRIRLVDHGEAGVDVIRDVRSGDYDDLPDEWTEDEIYEVRDHGITKISTSEVFS